MLLLQIKDNEQPAYAYGKHENLQRYVFKDIFVKRFNGKCYTVSNEVDTEKKLSHTSNYFTLDIDKIVLYCMPEKAKYTKKYDGNIQFQLISPTKKKW